MESGSIEFCTAIKRFEYAAEHQQVVLVERMQSDNSRDLMILLRKKSTGSGLGYFLVSSKNNDCSDSCTFCGGRQ